MFTLLLPSNLPSSYYYVRYQMLSYCTLYVYTYLWSDSFRTSTKKNWPFVTFVYGIQTIHSLILWNLLSFIKKRKTFSQFYIHNCVQYKSGDCRSNSYFLQAPSFNSLRNAYITAFAWSLVLKEMELGGRTEFSNNEDPTSKPSPNILLHKIFFYSPSKVNMSITIHLKNLLSYKIYVHLCFTMYNIKRNWMELSAGGNESLYLTTKNIGIWL